MFFFKYDQILLIFQKTEKKERSNLKVRKRRGKERRKKGDKISKWVDLCCPNGFIMIGVVKGKSGWVGVVKGKISSIPRSVASSVIMREN